MIGTAIVTGITLLLCVTMVIKDSIKRLRNIIKKGRVDQILQVKN